MDLLGADYTVNGKLVLHRNRFSYKWHIYDFKYVATKHDNVIWVTEDEWEILVDLLVE